MTADRRRLADRRASIHARVSVGWRKLLLLNRSVLRRAWQHHFPRHRFEDLRLLPQARSKGEQR
jgi:hypothetical protein